MLHGDNIASRSPRLTYPQFMSKESIPFSMASRSVLGTSLVGPVQPPIDILRSRELGSCSHLTGQTQIISSLLTVLVTLLPLSLLVSLSLSQTKYASSLCLLQRTLALLSIYLVLNRGSTAP